ncbi:MAG: hypothetical protein H6711_33125 [Myxococcales bacterium]|nr:hypothetical protein [Myxococcales bacterium]
MPTKRPAVIIDTSDDDELCAGLAGDEAPRAVFNSVGGGTGEGRFGRVGALDERLRRVYEALGLRPSEQPLLVIEATVADARARGRLAELAFNVLEVPALQITSSAVALVRAEGAESGLVLEIDAGSITATPVIDGRPERRAIQRAPHGAREIAEHIAGSAEAKSLDLGAMSPRLALRRLSRVALDYDEELRPRPEGALISARKALERVIDALFKPSLIGLEQDGIHRLALQAIDAAPAGAREALLGRVVLGGGASALPGLDARLQRELQALAPGSPVRVRPPSGREHAAFIGGSLLSTFEEMWIPREEYAAGPEVILRKCQ